MEYTRTVGDYPTARPVTKTLLSINTSETLDRTIMIGETNKQPEEYTKGPDKSGEG